MGRPMSDSALGLRLLTEVEVDLHIPLSCIVRFLIIKAHFSSIGFFYKSMLLGSDFH